MSTEFKEVDVVKIELFICNFILNLFEKKLFIHTDNLTRVDSCEKIDGVTIMRFGFFRTKMLQKII